MKTWIVFVLLTALVSAKLHLSEQEEIRLNQENGEDADYFWYTQRLDHFNPQDNTTWQQRYFDIDQYWDPETGPLFLYICGEGTCRQPAENSLVVNMAREFKGRVVALEHRYYGISQPVEDWSTDNLEWLTPDQGLADLAQFATAKSQEFSAKHGIPHRRWITVGGSYPGAMSAWFRYKFPHIAFGSLASSAVVKAIADYHEYDEQLYKSTAKSGVQCPEKFINATQYIENLINTGHAAEVYENFGYTGTDLPVGAFYYFLGDMAAGPVQSGTRSTFCSDIGSVTDDPAEFMKYMNVLAQQIGLNLEDYSLGYMRNSTIDTNKNARQWTYQTCANLGYFQTPAEVGTPMRGSGINITFWEDYCNDIYGKGLFPDTSHWNLRYGGKELAATRIIFTNGGEDPWQHASVTKSTNPGIKAFVIDCDDCAHCVDLRGDKVSDPFVVTQYRQEIKRTIKGWIDHEYKAEAQFPQMAQAGLRELFE